VAATEYLLAKMMSSSSMTPPDLYLYLYLYLYCGVSRDQASGLAVAVAVAVVVELIVNSLTNSLTYSPTTDDFLLSAQQQPIGSALPHPQPAHLRHFAI
jgi:hypothetical protein